MPATKITDLLPVPPGTRQPHPYQVLGLDDGEQDPDVIASALQSVVSRLKAAKPKTDPILWKQAARLVKVAQEVLADPDKKAQLDARFGIVSMEAVGEANSPPSPDALAAFLPSADPLRPASASDPLASVLPTANPLAPATPIVPADTSADGSRRLPPSPVSATPPHVPSDLAPVNGMPVNAMPINGMPPGLFGTPTPSDGSGPPGPSVGVVIKAPRAKRRQSKAGTILFLTFAFGTFGIIGALVYFILFGPGQVAITQADGKVSISTQPMLDGASTIVSEPRPVSPAKTRPPRDPIMGDLISRDASPDPLNQPSGLARSLTGGPSIDFDLGELEPMPASEMAMDHSLEMKAVDDAAAMPTLQPEVKPQMEPEMAPLTAEMIAEADRTLENVRVLIRSANWGQMKSAAEAALDQRMSEEQQLQAQALFELADLATYYRVGIEKAVSELKTGNDFEVTEDVRVIVVETGPDLLVIRLNAKNRSYTFDQLPWSLAHKLATFSMPGDDPTVQAAGAVYQAISPSANEEYRDQALLLLDEIQGEVEGADTQRLAETIRSLFVES